ncbi:hypothetical protein Leryth_000115, partial [Lithospermum erythrorhizon]
MAEYFLVINYFHYHSIHTLRRLEHGDKWFCFPPAALLDLCLITDLCGQNVCSYVIDTFSSSSPRIVVICSLTICVLGSMDHLQIKLL